MSTRTALAAAIGTVEGIRAHEYVVGDTDKGTAYPRVSAINYPDKFGGVVTWDVIVILPQDLGAAEKYLDDHAAEWVEALTAVMDVTAVTPQRLQLDSGILPAAFITGRCAADHLPATEA